MDQPLRIADHQVDLYHLDPYTPWGVDRRLMRIQRTLDHMFNTCQFELALKYARAKGVHLHGECGMMTKVSHVKRTLQAPNHHFHQTSPVGVIMSTLAMSEQKLRRRPVQSPRHYDPTGSSDNYSSSERKIIKDFEPEGLHQRPYSHRLWNLPKKDT